LSRVLILIVARHSGLSGGPTGRDSGRIGNGLGFSPLPGRQINDQLAELVGSRGRLGCLVAIN
jgi:hypothetical protein